MISCAMRWLWLMGGSANEDHMMMELVSAHEEIQGLLRQIHVGDDAAWEELLRLVHDRLEKLIRVMFRGFPSLRGFIEWEDVLQNVLLRLLRALRQIEPASMHLLRDAAFQFQFLPSIMALFGGALRAFFRVRFFAGADGLLQTGVSDFHSLLQRLAQVRQQVGALEKQEGHAGIDHRRAAV